MKKSKNFLLLCRSSYHWAQVYCKKVLLGISLNSQEGTCARVSLLKERLWHRCFPVVFVKFPGDTSFAEHLQTAASVCGWFRLIYARVSYSGGHGGGCTPYLTIFFKDPPSHQNQCPLMEHPPLLKNEAPPLKHEKPFHEMILRKNTINNNLESS